MFYIFRKNKIFPEKVFLFFEYVVYYILNKAINGKWGFILEKEKIMPVLLGADLNCYSVARAFFEAYGVASHVFGKDNLGTIRHSKFIIFHLIDKSISDEALVGMLTDFACEHKDASLFLVGCTDDYAEKIILNKKRLSQYYFCPCPDKSLVNGLIYKAAFYETCEKYGIPYPETKIISNPAEAENANFSALGFPLIIKPSSSVLYWKYPFDGMKKVYSAKSADEAKSIVSAIYSSGYPDKIVLQRFVHGSDSRMFVLTCYSDKHGKVKMMCLGNVLLEEHTPKAIGNHAAIITCENMPLFEKIRAFLDDIGYSGFSNFDIKYDAESDTYRVFEINLRQGRSNYYVTGSGINIAKLIADDRFDRLGDGIIYGKPDTFWHTVPLGVVYKYTADKNLVLRAKKIAKSGTVSSSLGFSYDLRMNPARFAYFLIHNFRYYKKYRLYH